MKVLRSWLGEWVQVPWNSQELGQRLAMAGLEVEAIEAIGADDAVLDINVTPNRGDALSILGIARDVAALTGGRLAAPTTANVKVAHQDNVTVVLDAGAACPRFAGRLIRGVDNRAA